eukprot:SAG22_NODE_104_length_20159_cov_5.877517_2_plen_447_part_00
MRRPDQKLRNAPCLWRYHGRKRTHRTGRWTRTPTGFHTRTRKFETPYKTPVGELGSSHISETQRAQVVASEGTLITVNTMNMQGVPYCDYYEIHGIFVVRPAGADMELISLQSIGWKKHTWLKSKITSVATTRAVGSFDNWRKTALPAIEAFALRSRMVGPQATAPSLETLTIGGRLRRSSGGGASGGAGGGAVSIAGSDSGSEAADSDGFYDVCSDEDSGGGDNGGGGSGDGHGASGGATSLAAPPQANLKPLPLGGSLAMSGLPYDKEEAMRWSVDAGGDSWWTLPSPRARQQTTSDVFEFLVVGEPKSGRTSLVTSFCRWAALRNSGGGEAANGGGERQARITLHSQDICVRLAEFEDGGGGAGGAEETFGGLLRPAANSKPPPSGASPAARPPPPPPSRPADAVLVVYDTTDRRSFHQLASWFRHARAVSPTSVVSDMQQQL